MKEYVLSGIDTNAPRFLSDKKYHDPAYSKLAIQQQQDFSFGYKVTKGK